MNVGKQRRLKAAGWEFGTPPDFLGLTRDEAILIETRLVLTDLVRRLRKRSGLTQGDLAKRLGSSQSRVAKVEAGDSSVSLDLIVRAAVAAGSKASDLARAMARVRP